MDNRSLLIYFKNIKVGNKEKRIKIINRTKAKK